MADSNNPTEPREPLEALPVSPALASPLSLLLEEERRGRGRIREVLLLSFTADLGFFESVALGVAQSLGARVSIVADVTMSRHDPRAVRRAGRSYLAGLASMPGAFHPKLVVLVGAEHATIAIGSGNATLAGWQANSELWTVLLADTEHHPALLPDLSAWLRELPQRIRLSTGAPEALGRVADLLQTLTTTGEPGMAAVRLLHNLTAPILGQLPRGPVEELSVFAPFHDPTGAALQRVCERLEPAQLSVAYQPGLTDLNGAAVADLVQQRDGRLVRDPDRRYRHGKLIEWHDGEQRWALTGSANLSAAALLRTQADGGNCELALLTPISTSLLPTGEEVALDDVRSSVPLPRARVQYGPLLLAATRAPDGLHVQLALALHANAYLQLSGATAAPETWERIADVPAGTQEMTVTGAADAGSRLRLVVSEDDVPHFGNIVFVSDPDMLLRRLASSVPAAPTTQPGELFNDPALAERFFTDMHTLHASIATAAAAATPAATGTSDDSLRVSASIASDSIADGEAGGGGNSSDWQRYLDDCAGRLGHNLLHFALGLPRPPAAATPVSFQDRLPVSWDEDVADDADPALSDDTAETAETADTSLADASADDAFLPDLTQAPAALRERYQRWITRLVGFTSRLSAADRLLVLRLTLWTIASGAWPASDRTWMPLLSSATVALDRDDLPQEIEPHIASLAAVALTVLRAHAPRHPVTEHTRLFTSTATAVTHLLPAAEEAFVKEYTALLEHAFATPVTAASVLEVAASVVQADVFAEAERILEERGRTVHRHPSHLLHVSGHFGNPTLAALEAIAAAENASLVGAWASSDDGIWALVVWRKPDLIVVAPLGSSAPLAPTYRWQHLRLSGLLTPSALTAQGNLSAARRVPHGPQNQSFTEADDLLRDLGLDSPKPPVHCASNQYA